MAQLPKQRREAAENGAGGSIQRGEIGALRTPLLPSYNGGSNPVTRQREAMYRPWSRLHRALLLREYEARANTAHNRRTQDRAADTDGAVTPLPKPLVVPSGTALVADKWKPRSPRRSPSGCTFIRSHAKEITEDYILWANLASVVGAFGYVLTDFARGFFDNHWDFTYVLYVVLGFLFVGDAIAYWAAWQGCEEPPIRSARIADACNIIASMGYAGTAILYQFEVTERMLFIVLYTEFAMTIVFVISAVAYTHAWFVCLDPTQKHRGCTWKDADWWGNAFNVVPAMVYVLANAAGILHAFIRPDDLKSMAAGAGATDSHSSASVLGNYTGSDGGVSFVPGARGSRVGDAGALALVSQFAVFADVLYLIDAFIYCYVWYRDVNAARAAAASPNRNNQSDSVCETQREGACKGAGAMPVAFTNTESATTASAFELGGNNVGGGMEEDEERGDSSGSSSLGIDDVSQGFQAFGFLGHCCVSLWSSCCCQVCYYRAHSHSRLTGDDNGDGADSPLRIASRDGSNNHGTPTISSSSQPKTGVGTLPPPRIARDMSAVALPLHLNSSPYLPAARQYSFDDAGVSASALKFGGSGGINGDIHASGGGGRVVLPIRRALSDVSSMVLRHISGPTSPSGHGGATREMSGSSSSSRPGALLQPMPAVRETELSPTRGSPSPLRVSTP